MKKKLLLDVAIEHMKSTTFFNHKKNALKKNTKLKNYNINPFILNYLTMIMDGQVTAEALAKSLYYPRVLGPSLNTTFGSNTQKMCVEIGLAKPSILPGMDVEFIDKIDKRKKYCQLKSGPNTINSDDVDPILDKFDKLQKRARTNAMTINNNDLIIGVLYGDEQSLSSHYLKIDKKYPVHIGSDFWHRITGFKGFYSELNLRVNDFVTSLTNDDFLHTGCKMLEAEIDASNILK